MDNAFDIQIIEQGWLGDGPGFAQDDLCSHGMLKIIIGGQNITEGSDDYGVSETALALLRTLENDYPDVSYPDPFSRLVFHGCGLRLMSGCEIGIDWKVEHLSDKHIRLSDIRRFDNNGSCPITFPGLTVVISEEDYRRTVVEFAKEAKSLFDGIEKKLEEDWDREQYEQFWREYDQLLKKYDF